MVIAMRRRSVVPLLMAVLVAASAGAGCSVEEPTPSFTGPSEFALSISLVAAPDQLPRDGSSESVITVTVRNEAGRPVSGQRLAVASNVGTVSESEIVTGEDGQAAFAFIAPTASASAGLNSAVLQVTPIGGNTRTTLGRTLNIPLVSAAGVTSSTVPTASFTFSPSAPVLRETVTFDASATMDEGVRCLDLCTYSWDFGGEATGSGRIVTHQFQAARVYAVTLTVTDAVGSVGTTTQNVTVTRGTLPTATFTFSPTSPGQFETVHFSAAESVAAAGRSITSYQWNFGDGSTATGMTASHAFQTVATFAVVLTVTDNAGLQAAKSQNVTVTNGVTADFTISRSPAPVNKDVFFDAEASKGSHTGFGGRNSIVKYIWNFGDSTSLTETTSRVVSHKYTETGTYTINLTVEDSAGRRNTKLNTLKVE